MGGATGLTWASLNGGHHSPGLWTFKECTDCLALNVRNRVEVGRSECGAMP
jgi:hypothetical protein